MKITVGRVETVADGPSVVLVRVEGVIGEEAIKILGHHAGKVAIHLRIEPEEAKRVGLTMLDEANYCEEEMVNAPHA